MNDPSTVRTVTTRSGNQVDIRPATEADHPALFELFARIVADGDGWPQRPPLTERDFRAVWVDVPLAVVALIEGEVVGGYNAKPNHPGKAAHIANAGYIVDRAWRGHGIGRVLVEDSIERIASAGFDAVQFNLVFASNPARALYEELGWIEIGRLPDAVEGEAAIIYWRSLVAPT